MASATKFGGREANAKEGPAPRRSLLDLAPLELDCMNTLWPLGEGTVRKIRDLLAPRRPRAYTTIMTIMDRLARKGIVERRKSGRAYVYKPNLTADDARRHALAQVVDCFFDGSYDAAVNYLLTVAGGGVSWPKPETPVATRAMAAKAAAAGAPAAGVATQIVPPDSRQSNVSRAPEVRNGEEPLRIDETLL